MKTKTQVGTQGTKQITQIREGDDQFFVLLKKAIWLELKC